MKLTTFYIKPDQSLQPPLEPAIHWWKLAQNNLLESVWEPANRATLERADFLKWVSLDTHPLPAPPDREYYFADRHLEYWISGLTDSLLVRHLCAIHRPPTEGFSYLDFGCASGRVLRHFLWEVNWHLWGCDINFNGPWWIQTHLPPSIISFQNIALPTLPLESASFDCVTAYSVFTHIDLFEMAWLLELRRLLKPGGLLLISVHSERLWRKISPQHFMFDHLRQASTDLAQPVDEALFQSPMPQPRVAFHTGSGEANRVSLFHSDEYIRTHWGKVFQLRQIISRGHLFHDLVILQK